MNFAAQIVCFRGDTLPGVEAGKALPSEIRIAPWERVQTRKGLIGCGPLTEALLVANQQAQKRYPRIKLDLEHASVQTSATYDPAAPNAAEGDLIIRPGQGLFMANIAWTPEGEALVRGGSKKDISPAASLSKDGQIIFLHSAALCNHGEIDGLKLFSAANITGLIDSTTPDTMDPAAIRALCNAFLTAAGLPLIPEGATPEQMQAAATEAAAKIKAAMAPAAKSDPTAKATPDLTQCNAAITQLQTEVEGLKKARAADAKQRIMDAAIAAGKVVAFSAAEIEVMPLETFSAHVDKLQAGVVPMDKRHVSGVQTFSAQVSADRQVVISSMGISPEDYAKFGPKD